MARCDSCGRDKETVEHGGRQLCLACLRAGGVPAAPAGVVASEPAAAERRAPREAGGPVCYLIVEPGKFDSWAIPILDRLKDILSEENYGYAVVTLLDGGDPQLGPRDMAVTVKVTEYDLGDPLSRFVLFLLVLFLLPLAVLGLVLGVGVCKLAVEINIVRGDGDWTAHRLEAKRHLPSPRTDLMDANARAIAVKLARKVTARRLLNTTVYQLAPASLIVGLASFIPYFGIVLAVPGLVAGIAAVAAIRARDLPRRQGVAVAGVLLCLLGPLVTVYLMMRPQRSGDGIAEHSVGRTEAVSIEPKDAEAYFNRGVARSREGGHDDAIADLTKAIELKPDYAEAYASRAAAYAGKGEYDSAIADCTRAIELKPDYPEAYASRGAAFVGKGDHDRGIADCTRAIELDPDCAEAYKSRGLAYRDKEDYDRAIEDLTEAIDLAPDLADAYYCRGSAYGYDGQRKRAIADFTRAIELRPDHAEAYYERGVTYVEDGDHDGAIADLTQAVQLRPGYAEAYYNRGAAYGRKGEYYLAKRDLEMAAALDPRGPVGGAALRVLRSMEGR